MVENAVDGIVLDLGAREVTLRYGWERAQKISRAYGGIAPAIDRIGRYDFDAMVNVVAIGAGIDGTKDMNELASQMYSAGLMRVASPIIRYMTQLSNGGAPIPDLDDERVDDQPGVGLQ